MNHLLSQIESFVFKAFHFLLVLGSLSCTPEYLRPTLPGKIPIVKTLPNQNTISPNSKIQLKASCYSVEPPEGVGFLVSYDSGIMGYAQGVEKINLNIEGLALTNEGEYLFDTGYSVGSLPGLTKYYRAFCKNSLGIGYGEELSFLTVTGTPTVSTSAVSLITTTGAATGGNVTSDGGASVTARGVAYGTEQNPTTTNSATSDGTGTGVFASTLTGLTASTLYFVRAYATNSVGTAYGNEVSFIPSFNCGISSVSDVDNNSYPTVQIGSQCWIMSNLTVSKYRNGENIPTGLSNSAWQNTTSGAYAIYINDVGNDGLYGKLYNHYAVTDSRGLCPTGWHVPTDADWTTLENHLGGSGVAGGALKSTAMQPTLGGWSSPNTGATNSSFFTALPGGFRANNGDFYNLSNYGYWWSSFVVAGLYSQYRVLFSIYNSTQNYQGSRLYGLSVRCLKD